MTEPSARSDLPELLGRSPAMESVRRLLARAARVDAPVVLEGETGTGKSLAACWIHRRSARHEAPFVAVNCAGIPDSLFESEFFGHRRGAFTGAVDDHTGLFEAASGGTLFLDEVAELPGPQQAKLLTVLEEGRVRRVGDARPRPVDTRVVAATSRDLDDAVREGAFRADLFHRLALLRCTLPPLRERDDDVLVLADHFLDELGRKHLGCPARLTPAARATLAARRWPGNVRELAHAVEAALILAGRRRLDRSHLEPVLAPDDDVSTFASAPDGPGERPDEEAPEVDDPEEGAPDEEAREVDAPDGTASDEEAPSDGSPDDGSPDEEAPDADATAAGRSGRYSFYGTDEEEREMIRRALERFRGNRTRTARHLGMSRGTLRSRMRRYGI